MHLDVALLSGRFGVDWGGRYFFIGEVNSSTNIGAIAQPRRIVAVSQLKVPQTIFASEHKIYLCGNDGPATSSTCEIYTLTGERAILTDKRTIEDSAAILDVDPITERMLVLGSRDFLPSVRVLSLHDGPDTRLGSASTFALFLQPGAFWPN